MKHARIVNLKNLNNEKIKELYTTALLNSYHHTCQCFSKEHWNRDITDISFLDLLDKTINEKPHLTILFRDVLNEKFDIEHFDFGITTAELYLSISVNIELSKKLFENFNLKLEEY